MIIFVALPPWKFSGRYPCTVGCTNLLLSQERRLYLHPTTRRGPPLPLPIACSVLALAIVVEPCPHQALAADCPLLRCLGFNLAPSSNFFLLSLPSRSGVSHPHVVVLLALGVPSISKGCFSNTLPCRRTEWLQCLKFQGHLVTPNFTALNAEERAEQNLATFSFVDVSQKETRMELRASAAESPMASRT